MTPSREKFRPFRSSKRICCATSEGYRVRSRAQVFLLSTIKPVYAKVTLMSCERSRLLILYNFFRGVVVAARCHGHADLSG